MTRQEGGSAYQVTFSFSLRGPLSLERNAPV